MNPLGSLNFSGLIKTLVPGVTFAAALMLALRSLGLPVEQWVSANKELFALAVLVGGFSLGLISNTFVFCHLLDRWVRKAWSAEHADLVALENRVKRDTADLVQPWSATADLIDVEAILIDKDRLALLTYWMDRYWFYMEFDLNMVLAVGALMASASLQALGLAAKMGAEHPAVDGPRTVVFLIVLVAGLGAGFGVRLLLMAAARRNFERHKLRMISLQLSALRQMKLASAVDRTPRSPRSRVVGVVAGIG